MTITTTSSSSSSITTTGSTQRRQTTAVAAAAQQAQRKQQQRQRRLLIVRRLVVVCGQQQQQQRRRKRKQKQKQKQQNVVVLVVVLLLILLLISVTATATTVSAFAPTPQPRASHRLLSSSSSSSSSSSVARVIRQPKVVLKHNYNNDNNNNNNSIFRLSAGNKRLGERMTSSSSASSTSSSLNLCSKKNNYGSVSTTTTTTTTTTTLLRTSTKATTTSSTTLSLSSSSSSSSERDRSSDDCDIDHNDKDNDDDATSQQQQQQLEQQQQQRKNAVVGTDVGPKILQLAIPALGALLIDPLLTIADTAFVGKFASTPSSELAGMGSSTALLTFSFYIFNFLCTATTPLVAQKRASFREEEALQVGGQALSLALGLGTILSFGLIVFGQPLLNLMGTSVTGPLANKYAMEFLVVRSLAAPAVFTISASTGILRGYLDTKTPIVVLLAANIINFTLDVVLIAGLKMGPLGAALATTTAEWISAILFLLVLAGKLPSMDGELGRKNNNNNNRNTLQQTKEGAEKEDTIPLLSSSEDDGTVTTQLVVTPSLSIPPWDDVKPLVVASSAVFFRSTVLQLFLSTAAAFAARTPGGVGVAESSISAHQIAFQLWMLCSYTSDALAAASQALVADAIGRDDSNDVQEVSRTVFVYSSILGILLGTMLYIGFETDFLFDFFTNDEGTQMELLAISSLLVLSQPLNSLVFAADGVLQGAAEFPYQAKTMALSATVAAGSFMILQSVDPSTDELIHVWDSIIILQAMRGLTSAYKICDDDGPVRILSPANKNI